MIAIPTSSMLRKLFCAGAIGLLASCGGNQTPDATNVSTTTTTGNVTVGTGVGTGTTSVTRNVQPISVEAGPANNVNLLFTNVTVCAPNDLNNCQTIDHVLVDTGSSGLRIIASQLTTGLARALPQQVDSQGRSIVECTQFADGFSWGPIRAATVLMAGERASAIPIQVIGDANFSLIPADCANSGPAENTVQTFGANGVLGISNFISDCGPACAQNAALGVYYACSATGCTSVQQPLTAQVSNPVALFATDNNGVLLSLPAVPAGGAIRADGSMIFGIQTQANNGLGNATVLTVDPVRGVFSTLFNNRTYPLSFLDSGSNALYVPIPTIARCRSAFLCPAVRQDLSAQHRGQNGAIKNVGFSIENADALLAANNGSFTAFSTLAGSNGNSDSFNWGLPFFFGRNVFTGFESRNSVAGVTGPFIAY